MIRGQVNATREAVVPLILRDAVGSDHPILAIVDTGFNGFLTLPPDLIASLGLRLVSQIRGLLADGNEVLLEIFEAIVIWDGQLRTVTADCIPAEALVGMSLLEGFDLHIRN